MLLELKCYIQQNKLVTLASLVQHFKSTPDLIESMLNILLKKGCVVCLNPGKDCQSGGKTCVQCLLPTMQLYKWVV